MLPFVRRISYRLIKPGLWGAFVGFQCIATAGSEDAVRQLVQDRHR